MWRRKAVDPIIRLTVVERAMWRHRERRIVDEFRREQAASLSLIQGKRLLGAVVEQCGGLIAAMEGCRLTIRGVSDEARSALLDMSSYSCHVDAVGRYRDEWWIALRSDPDAAAPLARVVVLVSHLTVSVV